MDDEKNEILLEVVVPGGALKGNKDLVNEIIFDVRTFENMKLSVVNAFIIQKLELDQRIEFSYFCPTLRKYLDDSLTFKELNVSSGQKLIMENSLQNKRSMQQNLMYEEETNQGINIICSTRIFESDGYPIRKVRVHVPETQCCKFFMDDVSTLWSKNNLKFKFGRTVINPDKNFQEQGVTNNSEIVVTGGRS